MKNVLFEVILYWLRRNGRRKSVTDTGIDIFTPGGVMKCDGSRFRSRLDSRYSAQLVRCPRLSADDERRLHPACNRPDIREQLVVANLRLAARLALRFRGRGVDADDLISEANWALVRAGQSFDSSRGTRFSTYAGRVIVGRLRNLITRRAARAMPGCDPDLLPATEPPESVADDLRNAMAGLNEVERDVLTALYGVGRDRQTLGRIAERLGLSAEGVRQMKLRAMTKARSS